MMRKIGLLALLISCCLKSCPTCVGKITQNSPPFFSDSFYEPEPKDLLEETENEENEELMEDMEE